MKVSVNKSNIYASNAYLRKEDVKSIITYKETTEKEWYNPP